MYTLVPCPCAAFCARAQAARCTCVHHRTSVNFQQCVDTFSSLSISVLEWVLYICVYNISYICIFIQGDSLPHVNPSTTCSWVHCEQNKCMSTFLIEAPVKCYTHAQVSGQKNGTILKFTKPAIACVSATSIGRSTGMNQTFK